MCKGNLQTPYLT